MRLISQDGTYDFPYEGCTLFIGEKGIVATPIGEPETAAVMAIYSSKEKLKKVMEKLHNQYSYIWKLDYISSTVYFCDDPMLFKFPGEDEI